MLNKNDSGGAILENETLKQSGPGLIEFVSRTGFQMLKTEKDGIKLMMPLKPNVNHVGTMYAGALFTLAEMMGGVTYMVYMFNPKVFPIVKGLNIKFTKPARTDIFVEYKMDQAEGERLLAECLEKGKANYNISLELKDETGLVVGVTEGFYQIRAGMKF